MLTKVFIKLCECLLMTDCIQHIPLTTRRLRARVFQIAQVCAYDSMFELQLDITLPLVLSHSQTVAVGKTVVIYSIFYVINNC